MRTADELRDDMVVIPFADELILEMCQENDGTPAIAFTMLGPNEQPMGHIHLDLDSAIIAYRLLGELIMEVSGKKGAC